MKNSYRTNEAIKAPEVRVIGEGGKQVGVMPTAEALESARQNGLDLVEVAPSAKPPVIKIIDPKHYLFQQGKKEKATKKGKRSELKEVRIRPNIGNYDLEIRARRAEKFLKEGDRVKLTVVFRGREITHPEVGLAKMGRIIELLKESGDPEKEPERKGRTLEVIINPKR